MDRRPDIDRRLEAARLVGVAGLCVLAQFSVAMPEGYFGPAAESTPFGRAYAALAGAVALLGAIGHLRARAWATPLGLAFYAANVGVFLPALEGDPVRGAALAVWLAVCAARQLFPLRLDGGRGRRRRGAGEEPPELAGWRGRWLAASTQLALVAVAASVSVVGFGQSALPEAQGVCLALHLVSLGLVAPYLVRLFRNGRRGAALVPVPALVAACVPTHPGAAFLLLCAAQLVVLGALWIREAATAELLEAFFAHPAILIVATFTAQIGVGTLFLSFPAASADGRGVAALDALFTSTSATCVTGLIVLDTPAAFSTFGHVVLLGLIQVGGLSIMVLSTFAALALGRGLSLRGEAALGQVLDLGMHRQSYEVTRFIVLATVAVEAAGALVLAGCYLAEGEAAPRALWLGTFTSISAFCNAGFALHSDSVMRFARNPVALGTLGVLITLGGIGFTVLAVALAHLRGRAPGPLPLQARLVLVTSALLTLGLGAWYLVAEWDASLAGLEPAHKVTNALFQSVALRTAGFNSVDLVRCSRASLVVMCVAMFIGASPGSTGGGVKTTTLAVLHGTVVSALRGGAPIVFWGRTVPWQLAGRAAAVVVVAATVAFGGFYALLLTQRSSFEWLAFEACSAIGTVGLSLGATWELDALGKLIVCGLMFAGRIGPLTLVLLLSRPVEGRLGYPEAKLMIG